MDHVLSHFSASRCLAEKKEGKKMPRSDAPCDVSWTRGKVECPQYVCVCVGGGGTAFLDARVVWIFT